MLDETAIRPASRDRHRSLRPKVAGQFCVESFPALYETAKLGHNPRCGATARSSGKGYLDESRQFSVGHRFSA